MEYLIVEDEASLRELLLDVLATGGASVEALGSLEAARRVLSKRLPDVLLLDIKLPDGDGLEFLAELRAQDFRVPVIVMTAFATVDRAVEALKAGAADFLVKPFDNDRLRSAVALAVESGRRLEEIELSAGAVDGAVASPIIGSEGGLHDVVQLLPRIASSEATVLLRGESGTGKGVIARATHDLSPRRDGPFVALNCAAIPGTLLESELFGFERGAFTGAHAQRKGHIEAAEGGTLFLDEIGDMSLDAQARLLRVLQEREIVRVGGRTTIKVDVRILAATHQPLEKRVQEGRFRQDLLYRLNVVPIVLPTLRERKGDIPGLVEHFLAKHALRHGVPPAAPNAEVMKQLSSYHWPGNVRELENFVERSVVLGRFDPAMLLGTTPPAAPAVPEAQPEMDGPIRPLREVVRDAERRAVVAALKSAGGNKAEAARVLGVSYKTLFNKINEYGIKEQLDIS